MRSASRAAPIVLPEPRVTKSNDSKTKAQASTAIPFEQVFQNLMGKRVAGSKVSEEELFAASVGQQVKQIFGVETYQEYKLSFKIGMNETAPGRSGPSAERAARIAMRDLIKGGFIDAQQARDMRDIAFAAAQLDSNEDKLFDGIGGGSGDASVATGNFAKVAQLTSNRMDLFQTSGVPAKAAKPSRARSVKSYQR